MKNEYWIKREHNAFTQQGQSAESHDQLDLLFEAYFYFEVNRYKEALDALQRALSAPPGAYEYLAHYLLWKVQTAKPGRKAADAGIDALKEAVELKPDFAPAYSHLWIIHNTLRLHPEALVDAEFLVRLMPQSPRAYRMRAETFAKLGRAESAERDLNTALGLSPRNAFTYDSLREAYSDLGRLSDAIQAGETAVKLDPADWSLKLNLAYDYRAAGRYTEAISGLEEVLELKGETMPDEIRESLKKIIVECRVKAALETSE